MNTNLLPCPFCGSHDIGVFAQYEDDCPERSAIARCYSCDAQSAQMVGRNKIEMAIAAWNRRAVNHSVPTDSPLSLLLLELKAELHRAVEAQSFWPTDAIHASAILNDITGGLTQASLDFHFYAAPRALMRSDAIQVGAMALRFLLNIDSYKPEEKS
ncbi:Lar family restriction alleviation protein [Limnobaculum xujianqingii]|uniref:Lar family restriction alleviation protein n=1 Tax=Limnobaculum xujianqingii TaxID=2738837 RepID=UPI001127D69F|nr:Lar family restriction alleviation protein [Limnobaculum xujianqingii]